LRERCGVKGGLAGVLRERVRAELSDALAAAWYVSLLNRLEHAVREPRFSGSGSLGKAVAKEHRRTRRNARRLSKRPSDRELHDVRRR
jgi:hypothetical protein